MLLAAVLKKKKFKILKTRTTSNANYSAKTHAREKMRACEGKKICGDVKSSQDWE
jgi:hypothetical protein